MRRMLLSPLRRAAAVMFATCVLAGILLTPAAAGSNRSISDCKRPNVPRKFHRHLVTAIRLSGNLPHSWATSPNIPRIICAQRSRFSTDFHDRGYKHTWIGLFAMTKEEVKDIMGPWLSNDRNELILSPACFAHGWDACPHRSSNTKTTQQLIAGLRWIWLMYGRPATAWQHMLATGRFNSYPRGHLDMTATKDPFRLCPVKRPVHYQDDFGEKRNVGGYHPHWGNDIIAPTGRPIRAPFTGFAKAHADNWFAGKYVTVIGQEGYVRNAHLSRFGKLGYVKAGAVIGYVGETGDARSPHDHFDWRPWNVPKKLHTSPFGYKRIQDAIDPYPFLNKVCR
jgi:murein DD-endopeptidase MepM/ murein hydrolase activator NlpD